MGFWQALFTDFDGSLFAMCLAVSIAGGLVIFHAVAAYYHIKYYVRRKDDPKAWKCQPKRFLRTEQQRDAALLSSFNLVIGGAISGTIIYAVLKGWQSLLYFDVAEYGWAYTIASGVLLFVLNDAGAYYVHRALHLPWMYRRIHRHHHRFVATTPYVTIAVHPLELVALQASSLAPIFFIPFHPATIAVVLIYILVFNIIDHSGVDLKSSLPWQGPSLYHDNHHSQFHVNFGQHLMIWDRMHGTLRRKNRKYGVKVFGGRGAGDGDDGWYPY